MYQSTTLNMIFDILVVIFGDKLMNKYANIVMDDG